MKPRRPRKQRKDFNPGAWLASRRWSQLLPAAPALLTATAITATCVWIQSKSESLQPRYLSALSQAVESDETEVAERYANKLAVLGASERPEVQWIRTVIDLRQGRLQAAQAMLEILAPSDTIGYPQAHLFVAQQLAQRGNIDPEGAERLKHHLLAASSLPRQRQWTAMTLSKIYLAQNDPKAATRVLEKIVDIQPEKWLLIAKLKKQQGDTAGEEHALASAVTSISKRVANAPNDVTSRLALAKATFPSEGFRATETILLEGLRRNPEEPKLRSAMASLYVRHSDDVRAVKTAQNSEIVGALQLIERALQLAPNHPLAIQRLMSLLDEHGVAEERANQVLSDLLASGEATATVHLLVATRAMLAGDDATAKRHMDLGYEKNPDLPVLLNNLAWLVARQTDPNLEEALGYSQRAISLVGRNAPGLARLRDTRGHILVKMERWHEAIDDLEAALPQLSDRAKSETHLALAKAYRSLKQPAVAASHEKQAAAIGLETLPTDGRLDHDED
ncbi:tetratricopeptide repeat protein [Rosistilla carotiformis]|nr:hypothetical protein [Rosistilla carotiformis]